MAIEVRRNTFISTRHRGPARRRAPSVEPLEMRLHLSTSVLSYHYDNASTGVDPTETQLTPANVKTGSFGKLYTTPLDGQVYAQPLVDAGLNIASGINTAAGGAGVHDVVFAATENDSLYAIDTGTGAVLWQRSFTSTANAGGNINNTLGATAISTLRAIDVSVYDISPTIGITGTPVIDPANNALYVDVKTKETIGGVTTFVQRVHAINLSDGTDAVAPFLLGATIGANTNTTPIYVYGSGAGAVVDPYNATGKNVVQFNALRESNRAALSLVNGTLYVPFASHGDNGPYHGEIVSFKVASLATSGIVLSGVLNTSPNNAESGIWQGGGQLAFESDGSAFYFVTGNGAGGAPVVGSNGLPINANYTEAVVRAQPDPTTSAVHQNPNGWGMKIVSFFTPYNVGALDAVDSDFGSGAPVLLPDSAGVSGHPHLLIAGGKDGRVFVLDRDHLGGYNANTDAALNGVVTARATTPAVLVNGTLNTPAFFNGNLYFVSGYGGKAIEASISSTGQLITQSQAAQSTFGYLPGAPIISANGASNGIAWIMDRQNNEIHAYSAATLNTELWNSGQAAGSADAPGAVVKFGTPVVANGQVFVGTLNSLVVYGLTPPASTAPAAPVLAVRAMSAASINLTWTDASIAPNLASGYLIDESTDGVNFTQVTTAPAGATSIAIGALQANTTYAFEVLGYNGIGASPASNIASATTTVAQVDAIDHSAGFGGQSGLTLNGSSAINGNLLQLTTYGKMYESASAFAGPVDVTHFNTQFEFQLSPGTHIADGFTFTLQNQGPTALGGFGRELGFGKTTTEGGVESSIAVKFDLYNNAGEGVDSTGVYAQAGDPTAVGSINLANTGIDLHDGDLFLATLSYDGAVLTQTITDTQSGASVTEHYTINIPEEVGGATAYAGFTAGTGYLTATQDIVNWTYSANAPVSPNAPTGLGAVPASATSVALSWTSNSNNQTGYHLDRATDPDFTQNLTTQTLPANINTYTDTATGLAPGGTYYYRLRAFNSAGDSGNSNAAPLTIPVAPPKPTNQILTSVTPTEIDFSWQDNAGHAADGYNILYAVNGGGFSLLASLPPTSRPAPSTYSYSATGLTPGNFYEFHIVAFNSSGNNDFAGVNAATVPLPPSAISAVPTQTGATLAWAPANGAVSYSVYRAAAPGGEGATPLIAGITATQWQDTSATLGVTYYYFVTAVNGNAAYLPPLPSESVASAEVSATAGAMPTTLLTANTDIGAPILAGSSALASGIYTLKAGGIDIANASDQFQYDYAATTGDTTIVAQVTSQTLTHTWAKAGVMIRASTDANSAYADVVVTPGHGTVFAWRTASGAISSFAVTSPTGAPKWVKLVRSGNTFYGYGSVDGVTWTAIGTSRTIVMPAVATAGLAVCSVNPNRLGTATFANVSLLPVAQLFTGKLAVETPANAIAVAHVAPVPPPAQPRQFTTRQQPMQIQSVFGDARISV